MSTTAVSGSVAPRRSRTAPSDADRDAPAAPGAWTRLRRVRVRPTGRAGLHLLLGVVLYAGGANVAAGWVMALAGVVLGVIPWALVHAIRASGQVDVRRHLPSRATAGVPVDVALEVRAPTPATVLARDALTRAAQAVADPRPGRRLEATVTFERGVREAGEVRVDVSDPFGLVRVRTSGDVPGVISVLPPVPRVTLPEPAAGRREREGTVATRSGGVEAVGIREHVRGEPLRRVDWRATARHRHLIVREFAAPRRAHVRVRILGGAWTRAQMDAAAALASGLATGYEADGHEVEIASGQTRLRWGPDARLLLADLAPHAGDESTGTAARAGESGSGDLQPGVDLALVLGPGAVSGIDGDAGGAPDEEFDGPGPASPGPAAPRSAAPRSAAAPESRAWEAGRSGLVHVTTLGAASGARRRDGGGAS